MDRQGQGDTMPNCEGDRLRAEFERDGFLVIRQFLTPAEFVRLQEELNRYVRDVVPLLPPTHAFYVDRSRPETLKQLQAMDGDPFFRDYAQDARWRSVARQLLQSDVVSLGTEWFNKPAGTDHPTPPHQDNHYFKLVPADVLTMWLALDDVDEENGCLRYVPGSHRAGGRAHQPTSVLGFSQGLAEYGDTERAREVAVCLSANDLVVHHGWTIHRADPNRSATRQRRSFANVFRAEHCRVDTEAARAYQASLAAQHAQLRVRGA